MNIRASRHHVRIAWFFLIATSMALAASSEGDRTIRLRSGILVGPEEAVGLTVLCADSPKSCEAGSPVLLKLRQPADAEAHASAGVRLAAYVGHGAFIAYLPEDHPDAAKALPVHDWNAPYPWALRMPPSLREIEADTDEQNLAIVLHIGPEADAEAVGRRARLEGLDVREVARGRPRIQDRASRWGRVVFESTVSEWVRMREKVSGWPEVLWIDRAPVYGWNNDSSAWVVQSGIGNDLATPLFDRGLFGEGQVVGILDSGLDADSCFFRDDTHGLPATNLGTGVGTPDPDHRKILLYNFLWNQDNPSDPADWDDFGHGTHTAGSLAGDRPDSPGVRDHADGMAPAAKMIVQDTGYLPDPPSGCSDIPAFGCPTQDLYPFYEQARLQGARIHSNSYGDGGVVPINLYTAEGSRAADAAMWDYPDYLMVFSAGNGGPDPGTVTNPGTAKNSLSVGATTYGSSADRLASFSGRGPTLDGRLKPDLAVPGFGIVSSGSDGSVATNNCGTLVASGSSMACPTVAGLAALMREYFVKGFYPTGGARSQDGLMPSGALLKAALIVSAAPMADVAGFAPSNLQGWGRPVADDALYFAGDRKRLRIEDVAARFVGGGDEDSHTIEILDASEPLRVVLAWTDYPSNPVAALNLVNDLDLEVESPSGAVYLGNVFVGGQSSTGGVPDRLNNVEAVRVEAPEPGTWTVRVVAFAVLQAPQGYALVATGRIPAVGVELEVDSLTIDDSFGGNGDGVIDPGEWIDLPLTVVNSGDTDAIGVAARWESATPTVEVIRSESLLPDLPSGQTGTAGPPYASIRIATEHPCREPIRLGLTLVAAGYEKSSDRLVDTGSRSIFLREDFESSTDWALSSAESTAARGHWGVGDPEGTGFQPEADVTPDPASRCLFTAPNPDRGIGTDDVDAGVTVARSGVLDLSAHPEARLSIHRWWGHRDVGEDINDYFRLEIRENAASPDTLLEQLDYTQNLPQWFERVFRVADYVTPGPEVELKVSASDGFGPGSVIEAAVDEVVFWDPVCVPYDPVPNPVLTLTVERSAGDLVLSWQTPPIDPSHGEVDSYVVYRSDVPWGGFAEIDSVAGGTPDPMTVDPGGATAADDRYYLVIAHNGSGASDTLP